MNRPRTDAYAWTTIREQVFIDRLGGYSVSGARAGRRALLQGYVQSLLQRERWDGLDRDVIVRHAQRALLEATLTAELET